MTTALQCKGPLSLLRPPPAPPHLPPTIPARHLLIPNQPVSSPTTPLLLSADISNVLWVPKHGPLPTQPSSHLTPLTRLLPVACITHHLTHESQKRRDLTHTVFSTSALDPASTAEHRKQALCSLRKALTIAWRLPCSDDIKEAYWRLSAGITPGCSFTPWTCPCACITPVTPSLHSFWDCPVAKAIRQQLQLCINHSLLDAPLLDAPPPPPPATPTLTRSALWLHRPPMPSICSEAWSLICIAAIHAMDSGRRALWVQRHEAAWNPSNALAAVSTASVTATTTFWAVLQDAIATIPRGLWLLSPRHPCISVVDGQLVLNLPP
jgi:hypothetical protein